MATIIAHSGLHLNLDQKKQLNEALTQELSKVYQRYALYYHQCGEYEAVGEADGQITFYVCVPDCPTEKKREVAQALNRAVTAVIGSNPWQVIIIFKYHDTVSVGVDGKMKCDF